MSADDIIAKGREAWDRLKASRSFDDYLDVGHALMEGRSWAMREAHVNQTQGRAFNEMMGKWLREYGFADIGKATRSQIIACIKHEAAIKAWRADLPLAQRLKLNHPANVLARWQANKARSKADKPSPMAELVAKVARQEAEIKRRRLGLTSSIARYRAGRPTGFFATAARLVTCRTKAMRHCASCCSAAAWRQSWVGRRHDEPTR